MQTYSFTACHVPMNPAKGIRVAWNGRCFSPGSLKQDGSWRTAHLLKPGPLRRTPAPFHAVMSPAEPSSPALKSSGEGHSALLQGLGDVGDVPPALMPWLLRLAHVKSKVTGGDSSAALQDAARGILLWKAALERGLIPDDTTLNKIAAEKDSFVAGHDAEDLRWPSDPLREVLVLRLSTLGVARFAAKYPAVRAELLKGLLELIVKYYKTGEATHVNTLGGNFIPPCPAFGPLRPRSY